MKGESIALMVLVIALAFASGFTVGMLSLILYLGDDHAERK
jgi:hypothetical protein